MADTSGQASALAIEIGSLNLSNPQKISRTCRTCLKKFTENHEKACVFHPESFCGETAQRWLPPGETKGGGVVYYFYSCCGGGANSIGCCARPHTTFDEAESCEQRRPGMGLN